MALGGMGWRWRGYEEGTENEAEWWRNGNKEWEGRLIWVERACSRVVEGVRGGKGERE